MEQFLPIIAILTALLIGTMSPGPSFIVLAQTSMARGLTDAISVTFGLAVGSALFGILALAGLHFILDQVAWLYMSFKIIGGIYLIYLAYRIFTGSKAALQVKAGSDVQGKGRSVSKAFFLGLVTQMSNPKTAIVFAGVFATFLNQEAQMWHYFVLIPSIFLIALIWYSLVSIAFSNEKARMRYSGAKKGIDRLASGLLGIMGFSLIKGTL